MILLDIETIAAPADDPAVVAYLAKHPDKADALALSPWTGRVACVAVLDTEAQEHRARWCGYLQPRLASEEYTPQGWNLEAVAHEDALLREAWHHMRGRQVCTWNGTGFDIPFLVGRSLVHGVAIDRTLLEAKPWETRHLDLMAKLGRASSLDVCAQAMGLPSPKSDLSGAEVGAAWARGEFLRVAEYCTRDVDTLHEIYKRWREVTR